MCPTPSPGGAVITDTKKMILVDSSFEGEGIASSKAGEHLQVIDDHMRAFGVPREAPLKLLCDNSMTKGVANREASTARARHAHRRFHVLKQRVAEGVVGLEWVTDKANPVDYLTKWVSQSKLQRSVCFAQGKASRRRTCSSC